MKNLLKPTLANLVRCALLAVCMGLLSACANHGVMQHGIKTDVKGTQTIYDIQVLYGKEVIDFTGIRPPGSGGGWNAPMPVPDEMTVMWTVDGVRQRITISLLDKVPAAYSIENWRLVFYGEKVELWREVLLAPPATPTGLRPRQLSKVFP